MIVVIAYDCCRKLEDRIVVDDKGDGNSGVAPFGVLLFRILSISLMLLHILMSGSSRDLCLLLLSLGKAIPLDPLEETYDAVEKFTVCSRRGDSIKGEDGLDDSVAKRGDSFDWLGITLPLFGIKSRIREEIIVSSGKDCRFCL